MNKNHALGGVLVGLFGGGLLGALIFNLTGSLDLPFGFLLMMIFGAAGAAAGWFLGPAVMNWREKQIKPLAERAEYKRILDRSHAVEPSGTYRVDYLRFGVLSLVAFFLGAWFISLTLSQDNSLWIFAVFFFISALYNLGKILINIKKEFVLTPQGFIYRNRGIERVLQWKDVKYIREKYFRLQYSLFPAKFDHHVILDLHNGDSIRLDRNLKDIDKLADHLQNSITKHHLPIALHRVKSGREVDFEIFQINSNGIRYKGEPLSWHEVDRIIINLTRVQVQKKGKQWFNWADEKGWNLPNLRLFALIANEYTRVV